jgi:nucleoside-diphosphate-sugar epimerase
VKILITGNRGFIGSYLEKNLTNEHEIVGLSRVDGYDITDFDSLKNIDKNIDTIIHTAAVASNDYELAFQNNVVGTLNICKYAKENGVKRIILLSTIFAIDEKDNGYFNNYGKTKKISHELAEAYCNDNNIELTILKLAQVYDDARVAQKGQAMLYYFIDTINKESKINLFGKTNPLRNYIHIDYLCSIVNEVLQENKVGTWSVVEQKNHTISEIAYMLFDILNKKPNISYFVDKPNIPSVHIPTTNTYKSDKISSIPLIEGMKRILNYDK